MIIGSEVLMPWPISGFFAAMVTMLSGAMRMKALIAKHQPRVLVMDMSSVPDIEYSALQMLMEGEQRFGERGVTLWLAGLSPGVLEIMRHSGLAERLGHERMLFNAHAAIEQFQAMQAASGADTPAAAP